MDPLSAVLKGSPPRPQPRAGGGRWAAQVRASAVPLGTRSHDGHRALRPAQRVGGLFQRTQESPLPGRNLVPLFSPSSGAASFCVLSGRAFELGVQSISLDLCLSLSVGAL